LQWELANTTLFDIHSKICLKSFYFFLSGHSFIKHLTFIFQQNKDENCKDFVEIEGAKHEETAQEKSQNSLMSSFAEKAMSVAGPVVPTKGDGEVDHERSVNIAIVVFLCLYFFFFFFPFLCENVYHVLTFCKQACCSSS
jgi:hypothetical protein